LNNKFFENAELHFIIFDEDLKVIQVNEAIELPVGLYSDKPTIVTLFQNLIDNAIKVQKRD
jgi:hypothetical protein